MGKIKAINKIRYPSGDEYKIEDLLFVKEDKFYFPIIVANIEKPFIVEIPIKKIKKILQSILESEEK